MKKVEFYSKVADIFSSCGTIGNYKEHPENFSLSFTISGAGPLLRYDELEMLSELLGTKDIGLEGELEYGYYDEEVDGSIGIYCLNVVFEGD